MANSDPHPIFFLPSKTAIRAALVQAGMSEMEVSFNAIERDSIRSATILNSRQIPPVMNRTGEVPARKAMEWFDSAGDKRQRVYASSLIVHFDVDLKAPSIVQVMDTFFGFMAAFPRSVPDGHRLSDPLAANYASFLGNPIELSVITPTFPDDTVVTAKDYRCSFIVRAEGGIYFDSPARISVTPSVRVSPNFLA